MEKVKELLAKRKWYDAYLYIDGIKEEQYTDEFVEFFVNAMFPVASQVYPLSLAQTVIKLTKNYHDRLSCLIELEKKIQSSVFQDKEHHDALTLIKIAITDILFKKGENIEREIYEFKEKELTDEQQVMFDNLALEYFESLKNYNESYFYAKRLGLNEKMVNYAIHATNVYSLPKLQNEPAHFKAIREGDFKYIRKFKTDNHEFILQKTYIIRILETCRNQKKVNLTELSKMLQLDKVLVIRLIIKALSLKLMKGKINGEQDILELTHVSLQTVTKENLIAIREQFEAWRDRVDEVIEAMK